MSFRHFVLRLVNVARPGRAEAALTRETDAHLALLEDDYLRRGLSVEDARLAARRAFAGVEQMKDRQRDARSFAWLDDARRDLHYSARLLVRNPIFALTAALSLAIGIGANTTIFTIANALLLRAPAGVADPDRLVDIFHTDEGRTLAEPVSQFSNYLALRRRTTTLEGVYAYQLDLPPMSLAGSNGAELVHGTIVTASYFGVLGLRPAAGRLFSAADGEDPGASPIAVLSHSFWTRRFANDPSIVGRSLQLNRHPFVVVGVAPEGFQGMSPAAPDLWVPTAMTAVVEPGVSIGRDGIPSLRVMIGGRLKPGVSRGQAAAEVDAIAHALEREFPERNGGAGWRTVSASPIPGNLRPVVAGFLALLTAIVSLVLVIACANVAGVLLARATSRRREIAVRLAIGAGRARLVRQLVTETMLLFALGGAAGVLLARALTALLVASLPAFPVPVGLSLPLDGRVAAFAAVLSLIAAALSGLAPALHASKADVMSALKDESQGSPDRLRLRHAFVIAQVAFSLLLIVGAGLLQRALRNGSVVDSGFDPRGVETASIDLSLAGYTDSTGSIFVRELVQRIGQLPGVERATAALAVPGPGGRGAMLGGLTIPGVSPPNGQQFFQPTWNIVEPGYFAALRVPILAGRDFDAADRAKSEPVAIVSESAARRFWPGQDAVGKQMLLQSRADGSSQQPARLLVVGVARDLPSSGSTVRDGRGPAASEDRSSLLMYLPLQQHYTRSVMLITRAAGSQRVGGAVRSAVASMDPALPIITTQRLDEPVGPIQLQLRVAASVSSSLGIVGLLLAAIGVYGVTAYAVSCRTREIGIRVAMGAQRADIVGMVLRHGMLLVAIGSTIGLVLAAGTSRLLTRLLFGVPPLDPVTFAGAASLFALIGLAACYGPARRATRVDPVEALRHE
jgi:putative ABC transport system permease protein